jgi:multidrug resistance efflux pump
LRNVGHTRKTAVAKLSVAKGELAETQALEKYAEAHVKRMEDLFKLSSIEERLVDEQRAKWEAAKARRAFATGKILECEAQVALEQARVEMAQAKTDHAKLRLKRLQAPKRESSRQRSFWIDPATGNQYFVGAPHE